MERADEGKSFAAMSAYTAVLAKDADKLGSQARQAAAERAWKAVQRFYDKCKAQQPGKKGYPRFQRDCRSIAYKVAGWKLESDGKHAIFGDGLGIGRLRLSGTRNIEAFPEPQITRVRIIRRADGYHGQFGGDAERQVEQVPTGKQTGIDVGLNAASDGNTVEHPRPYRKAAKKLKQLGRGLSRKQKGSKNRQKARKAVAKPHRKVQRQREDHARNLACALVTSPDLIAFEDLQVRNLVKNRQLAKRSSDAGWAQFRHWVEYYARLHGIEGMAVPPAYTSQACSGCQAIVRKSLSVRTHWCPHCGVILDRDVNAALNILRAALRILGHRRTAPARPEAPLGDSGAATVGA
jgi:putative transposase